MKQWLLSILRIAFENRVSRCQPLRQFFERWFTIEYQLAPTFCAPIAQLTGTFRSL